MALSADEVRYIARLARMSLTDDEVERLRDQLSDIIDHFAVLSEIDTTDVPPTTRVIDVSNVWREDVVRPSLPREEVLANAPRTQDGFIRVRAVLE